MEMQRTQNSQNKFSKEEQTQGLTLPGFKTDYKGTVIRTVFLAQSRMRPMAQNNRAQKETCTYMVN